MLELLGLSALAGPPGEGFRGLGLSLLLGQERIKALKEAGPAPGPLSAWFLFQLVFSP